MTPRVESPSEHLLGTRFGAGAGDTKRHPMAQQPLRSARQVIDQAIKENRFGERLLYAFAIVLVGAGVFALIAGVVTRQGVVAVAGSVSSALFWPAMREARRMRRENMAIRLLEDPLGRAETSREAADAIREAFTTIFVGRQDDRGGH